MKFAGGGECLSIPTNEVVRNLGFYFDSKLNMEYHVQTICQACHYHLRNIGKIRNLTDAHTTHMLVHALITSRLDYCNSLLVGIPKFLKERLQKIQNKAARLITRKGGADSKIILKELYWLPIEPRIDLKIACHVYKCLLGLAPSYLSELIEEYKPSRTLRSSNSNLLLEHRSKTKFEERALYFYATKICKSLSVNTKNCDTFQSFKSHLKTDLLKKNISFIVVCLIF